MTSFHHQPCKLTCLSRPFFYWAVVVAHLTERSPPTQEIRGSNPVIGNLSSVNCVDKTKIKKLLLDFLIKSSPVKFHK